MNNLFSRASVPLLSVFLACGTLQAQTVRESITFIAVDEYAAGGANRVDISATSDFDVNAMSYETFLWYLDQAVAEGRGGVVDFEQAVSGDTLVAVDKTLVNAYTVEESDLDRARWALFDHPSIAPSDDPYVGGVLDALAGSDEALLYDFGDPVESVTVNVDVPGIWPDNGLSAGFSLIDPERLIKVEDRRDRQSFSDYASWLTDEINRPVPLADTILVRFGSRYEKQFMIGRGPMHISESDLATAISPGPRETRNDSSSFGGYGPINDEFYLTTWEGSSRFTPISGGAALSGGGTGDATAKDLLFDPRSNISAIGFTLCSINDFQYWQGNAGSPLNPDNIIVSATFSDGTVTDYRGTTQLSNGGADTFFGIEAPFSTAITRLQVRVVGQNYRTFTYIDDLAFITEPSAPFLVGGDRPTLKQPYAAIGRPFYRKLEFSSEPDFVYIDGLEALGLSYDPESKSISGTPYVELFGASEWQSDLPMTMSDANGTRVETVQLVFREPDPSAIVPIYMGPPSFVGTIGRDFSAHLDFDWPNGETLSSQVMVDAYRIGDMGERELIPLDQLGLSLSDGVISGQPLDFELAGEYELAVYGITPEGTTQATVSLRLIVPAPAPQFDYDGRTDWIDFDPVAGTVSVALTSEMADNENRLRIPPDGILLVPIIENLPAGVEMHLEDFDGDKRTDVLIFDPAKSEVSLYLVSGVAAQALPPLAFAPVGQWELAAVDRGRFVLRNTATNAFEFWTTAGSGNGAVFANVTDSFSGDGFRWLSGYGPARIALWADFNGDFQKDALIDFGSGVYAFAEFGEAPSDFFEMSDGFEPTLASNLANGMQILWQSGDVLAVWDVSGLAVPSAYVKDETSVPLLAGPGEAQQDLSVIGGSAVFGSGNFGGPSANSFLLVDESGKVSSLLHPPESSHQIDLMEDGRTGRPKVMRDDVSGEILTETRALTLGSRMQSPGEPLALYADESLNDLSTASPENGDYQIFEQAQDGEGNYLWDFSSDPFHALALADTSRPVPNGDVWLDGYIQEGQALANYKIFLRTGVLDGRPVASRAGRFGMMPGTVKQAAQPIALTGSQDLAWTPMATALDGDSFVDGVDGVTNYDARGNRGFLQETDLLGNPVFDPFGQPVYVLWKNSNGLTVEEQALTDMIAGAVEQVGIDALGASYPNPQFPTVELTAYSDSYAQWQQFVSALQEAIDATFGSSVVNVSNLALQDGFAGLAFEERGEAALSLVAQALSEASGSYINELDLPAHGYPGDVLLYELDYVSTFWEQESIELAPGWEFYQSADFDSDGVLEVVTRDSSTGDFRILYADERQLSRWAVWLRRNFGSESDPSASEGSDIDGDGASNMLEYVSGVEFVQFASPTVPALGFEGSDRTLEFFVRADDAGLSFQIERSVDLLSWDPVSYETVEVERVSGVQDRHSVKVTVEPGENEYYRVVYSLGGNP
jgi:hypothetical protein